MYNVEDLYNYQKTICDYKIYLSKKYKKTNDEIYLMHSQKLLIDYYNAILNVCDKIAIQLSDGNNENKEEFLVFLEEFNKINNLLLDLNKITSFNKNRSEMPLLNKEFKKDVNGYVEFRDTLNQYFDIANKIRNNDDITKKFIINEVYYITGLFQEVFDRISLEIANNSSKNKNVFNYICKEYDDILRNINLNNAEDKKSSGKIIVLKDYRLFHKN